MSFEQYYVLIQKKLKISENEHEHWHMFGNLHMLQPKIQYLIILERDNILK